MKMNKKGFTLIELLAVIVILAIIALIATPIVMNTINKAQESSRARSVEAYIAQVELGYASKMLETPSATAAELKTAAVAYADSNMNGEEVVCGTAGAGITMDNSKPGAVASATCTVATKSFTYTAGAGASAGSGS